MTTALRGNGSLWFAMVGGPVAWSVDALAAVAIDHDYCAYRAFRAPGAGSVPVGVLLAGIAVAAAIVTVMAGLAGWRIMNSAGVDTGLGDTDDDRRRFMARFGVVISGLTLFGILLRLIATLLVSPVAC